ncbi:type III secretion protein [Egibacter rhizosphaerae]|uniref:Type III secretion protein n=1 Tax=Egibacter rhizosphaerae TaxID=1670831 RepID=A0A411YJ41_9ACTN|nr:flagellar biosynthetic protein FliR [Egibacter rhizosphaerae]QBI21250.1 type III secretion protein [Egibacter rhizosphaerae]
METLQIALDPAQSAGLVLAMTRVTAFALVSMPMGMLMPISGRMAMGLAVGLLLAEPYEGALSLVGLFGAAVVNAGIGVALGWLTSIIFQIFFTSAAFLDVLSGLFAAVLFDQAMEERAGMYTRLFNMTAIALFAVAGGLELLVRGLGFTFEVIPVHGEISLNAGLITETAVQTLEAMMLGAAELILPVAAALFLVEITMGLASRFSPQTNVFLLGLPAKLLVALVLVSTSIMLFPEVMGGVMDRMEELFEVGIRAFMP